MTVTVWVRRAGVREHYGDREHGQRANAPGGERAATDQTAKDDRQPRRTQDSAHACRTHALTRHTVGCVQEPGNDFVDNQRFVVKEGLLARIKGEGKSRKERKLNVILFNDMVPTHSIQKYTKIVD